MPQHDVVNADAWLSARKALLQKEKEFTRARDALSAARRALPWQEVDTNYVFDGPDGKQSLSDLFEGRSQLLTYHFMFDPSWDEGCKSCSFIADHYDPAIVHLEQRDVTMVTVSRAPLSKLNAFRKRMGWSFKWVSSFENDFNHDYGVSFTQEQLDSGTVHYNYADSQFPSTEAPGLSVFTRDDSGQIFHTYSGYGRGLDIFLTAYNYLDVVPNGRDEADLPYSMGWLKLHDSYGS
jgi:predicted dithiol-disulfide oxidoreductase (DUF899 family)